MGQNKRQLNIKLAILIFVILTSFGCRTGKNIMHFSQNAENENSIIDLFISEINTLGIKQCELVWDTSEVYKMAELIHRNSYKLLCIKKKAYIKNDNAIRILVKIVNYWESDQPLRYMDLSTLRKVYDPRLFEALIEILKYQTEYDYSTDVIKSPIHIDVGLNLIEPMIKTIDGMPKNVYMKTRDYKQSYDCTAQEYYAQIKTLWKDGKITLKEQGEK